jgi:hypothetical protein
MPPLPLLRLIFLCLGIIFSGALLGFALARFSYLDIEGIFAKEAAPGEWFWYKSGYRRGMLFLTQALSTAMALPNGVQLALLYTLLQFYVRLYRIRISSENQKPRCLS